MVEFPNESTNMADIAQAKGRILSLSLSLSLYLSSYKRLNSHGSLALVIFENQIEVGHGNVADRGTIINGRRLNCRKLTLIRQTRRPREEISLATIAESKSFY